MDPIELLSLTAQTAQASGVTLTPALLALLGVLVAALASGSSGISSGDRTGGNLWLMVSRRRTALLFSYAVSATTPPLPSEWTLLAVVTNLAALNLARGTWSLLAAYVAATIAYGIDITAIRASAADGGEL